MRVRNFDSQLWLPQPRDKVFAVFSDAANLDAITPPWLNFRTVTPGPIEMHLGTMIDYNLRVHGFPVRWRSEITAWEPPTRFVDEQRSGPYRLWIHEHIFTERDGGTLVGDRVHTRCHSTDSCTCWCGAMWNEFSAIAARCCACASLLNRNTPLNPGALQSGFLFRHFAPLLFRRLHVIN